MTESPLTKDIGRVIQAHLPQQTSDKLAEHLKQLESDRAELAKAREERDRFKSRIDEYGQEVSGLRAEVRKLTNERERVQLREEEVADRQLKVDERARAFELEIANLRAEHAEARADAVTEIVRLVFQNNVIKHRRAVPTHVAAATPRPGQYASGTEYPHSFQGGVEIVDESSEG